MTEGHRPLTLALAVLLALSAGGFAWATAVERAKEAAVTSAAPEGSPEREAAERAAAKSTTTLTTATATTSPVPGANIAPATTAPTPTAPPTTLREGSPAREAAERAARTSTIPPSTTAAPTTTGTSLQVGDVLPPLTALTTAPATTLPPTAHRTSSETVFGVHTESNAATIAGVLTLLAAAVSVLMSRRRRVFALVAAVAALYAVLDLREAVHQHNEGRISLVAMAIALAVAHAGASVLGLVAFRPPGEEGAEASR